MKHLLISLGVAALLLLTVRQSAAHGGGGRLTHEIRGRYYIDVYVNPPAIKADEVFEIRVSVIDNNTYEPLQVQNVRVRFTHSDGADAPLEFPVPQYGAAEAAVYEAGLLKLPRNGLWNVLILVQTPDGLEELKSSINLPSAWAELAGPIMWLLPVAGLLALVAFAAVRYRQEVRRQELDQETDVEA